MDIVLTATKPAAAKLKRKSEDASLAYILLCPYYFCLGVHVFGIFYNVYIGLFEWSGIGSKVFIGLDNYVSLLHDPNFYQALGNTFYFLVMTIPLSMALGLLLATLLNGVWVADGLFKSIFFCRMSLPLLR